MTEPVLSVRSLTILKINHPRTHVPALALCVLVAHGHTVAHQLVKLVVVLE